MLSFLSRIAASTSTGPSPIPPAATTRADAEGLSCDPYEIISAPRQIGRLLQDLIDAAAPVTLTARGQNKLFQTHIKEADTAQGQILITQLWNDAEHAALLADGHINLNAKHRGFPIFFSLDVLDTVERQGAPCYRLPFPDWMFRMQMRDSLRIRLPESLHAGLRWVLPSNVRIEARVTDLSEGGVGLMLPTAMAEGLAPGPDGYPSTLVTLAGELAELTLRIRRSALQPNGETLLGCSIEVKSEVQRQALRRFILSHQRNALHQG